MTVQHFTPTTEQRVDSIARKLDLLAFQRDMALAAFAIEQDRRRELEAELEQLRGQLGLAEVEADAFRKWAHR